MEHYAVYTVAVTHDVQGEEWGGVGAAKIQPTPHNAFGPAYTTRVYIYTIVIIIIIITICARRF